MDQNLRDEINKRLTLNWLIQGASEHAGISAHYLVRDELAEVNPKLIRLYDKFAALPPLQFWYGDLTLVLGWPRRFWRRAATDPNHLFHHHPLLSRHGGALAEADRQRAIDRFKARGMWPVPALFWFQAYAIFAQIWWNERGRSRRLTELAKQATAELWGIPADRLDGTLTTDVAFGALSTPRTLGGRILKGTVIGYGGVLRQPGGLRVVARAWNWPILARELVKGTAELICLHGLNGLDDETYQQVMHHTDRIEFEPWMLQTGGELWRRLLAVLPASRPLSEMFMHIARLPPRPLESLIRSVIEQPGWARELLAGLGVNAVGG